jgi:hypothetical protein
MGISRYLFNDWFTATELDEVDRKLAAQQEEGRRREHLAADLAVRVEQLERDLARLALLARSLAEACVEQGVLPRELLKRKIAECDLYDGVEDGALDPSLAHPEGLYLVEVPPEATAPAEASPEEDDFAGIELKDGLMPGIEVEEGVAEAEVEFEEAELEELDPSTEVPREGPH